MASARESRDNVAKGTYRLASQTKTNLQSVALAVVAIGASGVLEDWNPWPRDQCLSEIHIERQFGQYRGQSQSGELSARSYFCASARAVRCQFSRRTSNPGEAAPRTDDNVLSQEQLLVCSCLIVDRDFL